MVYGLFSLASSFQFNFPIMNPSPKKLIVIGGGAAGFFCAVNAARLHPGLQVTLIEKTPKLLSKVKVSGGGRCNVTHACFSIAEMVKKYPRGESFLKKAFQLFFTGDTVKWFEVRGVPLKTEEDGRMFPASNNSQSIIDCLLSEAAKYKVEIMMRTEVLDISSVGDGWVIQLSNNTQATSDFICVASGGYAKDAQFNWLKKTGHFIEDPVPSLFTFNMPQHPITKLMGISVENVSLKIAGSDVRESGPLLITHWGLSGPVVLRSSAWGARLLAAKNYQFNIIINWLPVYNEITLKEYFQKVRFEIASQKIISRNPFNFPSRLWEYFIQRCGIDADLRWADLPSKEQNKLIKMLCSDDFEVKGKTTFKEEFVTAGGIQLKEVDFNTMQSKNVKGLFFAGEVLDIDGITGGYNFQSAWTTGWIAAQGVGREL
jgi:predicted Rossmann fold flavoprotein